jgi:hypothetical protein
MSAPRASSNHGTSTGQRFQLTPALREQCGVGGWLTDGNVSVMVVVVAGKVQAALTLTYMTKGISRSCRYTKKGTRRRRRLR